MSKDKIPKPNGIKLIWLDWLFETQQENRRGLLIFISILNSFVEQYPDEAKVLTVETMHAILLDEISK